MHGAQPGLADRFAGCLLGGAVGDALGAPFEGYWGHQIPRRSTLLGGFAEVEGYPRGQYTDDTQLTLATVESIVRRGGIEPSDVARAIADLWRHDAVVGPGGACTSAARAFLKSGDWTTCGAPVGQAGNGTAMRTAALGLAFLDDPDRLPAAVADVARITHHDPRSIAGGVAVAAAARWLATGADLDPAPSCAAVAAAARPFDASFAGLIADLPARLGEDEEAARHAIAWAGMARPEFSRPIITPFVVPTVLAALWSVLRRPDDWSRAVAGAIRLGGDVDTLGAIVGGLMGARLGVAAIPPHLADEVLDAATIRQLAHRYFLVIASEKG